MARDDFPLSVRNKLRDRVLHRCSKPGCRVPTSAPQDEDGLTNVGKAAHICAASPGGPRYDEKMTPNERKAFSNGIWLCAIHADEIDRDVAIHTPKLLKEWKRQAEAAAKSELGKVLPKASDATDLVALTLTGMSKQFLPNAIRQVHEGSAQVLAAADPRFDVVSRHDPVRGTSFQVNAKENVKLAMLVGGDDAQVAAAGYAALLETGHGFEIDSKNVDFRGSPLFQVIQEMAGEDGAMLRFSPHGKDVVFKLSATEPSTGNKIFLDDMQGKLTTGTKSCCLKGEAMNGMLSLTADASHDGERSRIQLLVCTERWVSCELTQLPWFRKIASFVDAIANEWLIDLTVELDGEPVLGLKLDLDPSEFQPLAYVISYIRLAKELSEFLDVPIVYDVNCTVTGSSYEDLEAGVKNISGYYMELDSLTFPLPGSCVITGTDLEQLVGKTIVADDFEAFEQKQITVFGQLIELPQIRRVLNGGLMEVLSLEGGIASFRLHRGPGMTLFSHYDHLIQTH